MNKKPIIFAAILSILLSSGIGIAVFSQANRSVFEKHVLNKSSSYGAGDLEIGEDKFFKYKPRMDAYLNGRFSGKYIVESDDKNSTLLQITYLEFDNSDDEKRFVKPPTHIKITHEQDKSMATFMSDGKPTNIYRKFTSDGEYYSKYKSYTDNDEESNREQEQLGGAKFYHHKEKFRLFPFLY